MRLLGRLEELRIIPRGIAGFGELYKSGCFSAKSFYDGILTPIWISAAKIFGS